MAYDDFEPDIEPIYPPEPEDEPFWTRRRLIYLVIVILLVIALLAYLLWPTLIFFFQPGPTPPVTPTDPPSLV